MIRYNEISTNVIRKLKPGIITLVTVLERIVIGSKIMRDKLPKIAVKTMMKSRIYFAISQWD